MLEICKYVHGTVLEYSVDIHRVISTFPVVCITHIKCVVQSDN